MLVIQAIIHLIHQVAALVSTEACGAPVLLVIFITRSTGAPQAERVLAMEILSICPSARHNLVRIQGQMR